jgi:hypothetical protein
MESMPEQWLILRDYDEFYPEADDVEHMRGQATPLSRSSRMLFV